MPADTADAGAGTAGTAAATAATAGVRVRRAGDADWPAVWPVWHEIVAPGDTYCYEPASTSEQGRAIWLGEGETWMAEAGDDVLGTYHLTTNQPGAGSHVANASYMVAARARGRGLGATLVRHSIARAGELGYRGIQFNAVAATNTGAVALYHRLGFATVGLIPGGFRHPVDGFVDLHVMYRSLCAD